MARPKATLPPASAIRRLADDQGRLELRAAPNAAADAIVLPPPEGGGVLTVRTTVTPEDGKANVAILRLLAKALGCPVSSLELVRGASSRHKLVRIPLKSGI